MHALRDGRYASQISSHLPGAIAPTRRRVRRNSSNARHQAAGFVRTTSVCPCACLLGRRGYHTVCAYQPRRNDNDGGARHRWRHPGVRHHVSRLVGGSRLFQPAEHPGGNCSHVTGAWPATSGDIPVVVAGVHNETCRLDASMHPVCSRLRAEPAMLCHSGHPMSASTTVFVPTRMDVVAFHVVVPSGDASTCHISRGCRQLCICRGSAGGGHHRRPRS